jgi:outer membrane protein TolC
MKKVLMIMLFCCPILSANGQRIQDSVFMLPDTVKPFTLNNLYEVILRHHPVARQAGILPDIARQEIRLARGNFDPKLETQYLLKHYRNTEYYRLFDASVKVPTRSPIVPSVGLERNTGKNLNPENYISEEYNYRQFYAGISIPLGRGLVTDERRTVLKQAELFTEMMEAEQIKTINKLLLDAAKDYWQWYYSFYNYRLAIQTTQISEQIMNRTKMNFEGGEAAVIDTIQTGITLLERKVNLQESLLALKNNTLKISTHLWDSLQNPLELDPQYVPVAEWELTLLPETSLEELTELARKNHPEIRKLNVKREQLALDQRLAREFMKPKFDVSYYRLNQPFTPEGIDGSFAWNDNYKLGIDFSIPLFLRKERAKLAQTRLKLTNTNYELHLSARQIINDINSAYNELVNNAYILRQQQSMVDLYQRLMNAELTNLENGESDLFKINIQQEKLFNAQSKLIKVIADYQKQKAILYWSAGRAPLTN